MNAVQFDAVDFATRLRNDIAENKVRLPTLPDIALKVRDAVEAESAAPVIARLISQDAAMSGRLLQVANCPLYRGKVEVESVQTAVTRLGTKLVRTLILSLAMRQLFKTTSRVLQHYMRNVWEDSVQIAAISRVIASAVDGIDAEQAMLGGLMFNIGALPILARLDESGADEADNALVEELFDQLSAEIGAQILQAWNLPESLQAIPSGCLDVHRDPGPFADYVDVVLAARLQHLLGTGRVQMRPDWTALPAFQKLGIHVEVIILEEEGPAVWAKEVTSMLNV